MRTDVTNTSVNLCLLKNGNWLVGPRLQDAECCVECLAARLGSSDVFDLARDSKTIKLIPEGVVKFWDKHQCEQDRMWELDSQLRLVRQHFVLAVPGCPRCGGRSG